MKHHLLVLLTVLSALPSFAGGGLKVHEWGTFTSVQGSDGQVLTGLEHEEEALPSFVHNRDAAIESVSAAADFAEGYRCSCKQCCKGACCDDFAANGVAAKVTQKMETPVLYFYSDQPATVDVTVDFPRGIISQYYPRPSSFLPELSGPQSLSNGRIHYAGLKVLTQKAEIPSVLSGNVYAPARETKSNIVSINGENEKFIFYRGLGDFRTSLQVSSTPDQLTLRDTQGRGVPYVLAVNIRNGKGSFKELGALERNQTKSFPLSGTLRDLTPSQSLEDFELGVMPKLVKALERSGLFPDEAQSMVNTWRSSYFHTEGLRVLYILPREETDRILPIKITPAPSELVRTLVGRIEVLTNVEEKQLLSEVALSATAREATPALSALGRFKAPKLLRVQQLTKDRGLLDYLKTQIN